MTKDKEDLVLNNLNLVYYVVNSFKIAAIPREDLISIGTIGLLQAAKTFDLSKNFAFSTYAITCIRNQILMVLRKVQCEKSTVSIDDEMLNPNGESFTLLEILGSEDKELRDLEDNCILLSALNGLPNKEKQIICLRYGLFGEFPQTQKQVAKKLNISQSYLSRLEKKALAKLRRELL